MLWLKRLGFIVSTIALGAVSYTFYRLYTNLEQVRIDTKLMQVKFDETANKQATINTKVLIDASNTTQNTGRSSWLNVQKQVADTVIQVFANVTEFNIFEPYKTPKQNESRGSGFFINEDGHIVTNYHVVAQASNVEVQIPSLGLERFDATIIGVSPERDIALLKLTDAARTSVCEKLTKIPYLKLGDSDLVLRSQEVLALGYPLGQSKLKSTMGIVSGRERLGFFGYIQITAPLNQGNSGGPALNTAGEVIGINSCGILDAQNVGYIIPINEVRNALDDLYSVQLLRKPTLGCIFTVATKELVNYLGNPSEGGWYIAKIFDNTLFKSIGVQENDMLYEVNGHKIDLYGELNVAWSEDKVSLLELLNRYKIGDTLNLLIYRNGTRKDFSFKLEHKFLPPLRTVYYEFEKEFTDYEAIGGMIVMQMTLNHVAVLAQRNPEMIKYGRIEYQQEPILLISQVLPNSQASKSRVITPGALLNTVNGEKVKTLEEFRKVVKKHRNAEYLTIKTHDNMLAALSIKKVIADEARLAKIFFHRSSTLLTDDGAESSHKAENKKQPQVKKNKSEEAKPAPQDKQEALHVAPETITVAGRNDVDNKTIK